MAMRASLTTPGSPVFKQPTSAHPVILAQVRQEDRSLQIVSQTGLKIKRKKKKAGGVICDVALISMMDSWKEGQSYN